MKNIVAIVMSDLHARSTAPKARKDDYVAAMERKLRFIRDLCIEHACPLIDCGDLFDTWKSQPKTERMILELLPQNFYSVPGNHEMPYHNADKLGESSFAVIQAAGRLLTGEVHIGEIFISGKPYTKEIQKPGKPKLVGGLNIGVVHGMVWPTMPTFDGAEGIDAPTLHKMFRGYDFVLCGHNHETFVYETDTKPIIINPGSVMRSSISQRDHVPTVFALLSDGTYTRIPIPCEPDVFNEQEYKKIEERDSRIEAFVEKLKDPNGLTLDFKKNISKYVSKNALEPGVVKCLDKIMEEANV